MSVRLLMTQAFQKLVVPLCIVAFAIAFYLSSRHLPFMSAGYPRFLIVLLLFAITVVIVRTILSIYREASGQAPVNDDSIPESPAAPSEIVPVLVSSAILVGFVALIAVFGIRIAVLVFVPVMLIAQGYFKIWWIIGLTAGAYVMLEVLFIRLFQLPLPGVW